MRWKLVTWITLVATNLSHILVRKRVQQFTFREYSLMPEGSLGKTYYDYLKMNKIPYKPNLIRHDLKHVVLGYGMNMPDELRIHAFLLGNRSYNFMAIAYLGLCVLIVPETIAKLKQDFRRGRKALCLKDINLQELAHKDLSYCHNTFKLTPVHPF